MAKEENAIEIPRERQPLAFEQIPIEAYGDEPRVNGHAHADERPVTAADFWAYMPAHAYIYVPTRELWPAASINSRIPPIDVGAEKPIKPSNWLDQNRAVEQMTWAPGMPMVIKDRLVSGGGWIERAGCRTFNLYAPPAHFKGDPGAAGRWLEHLRCVFPAETDHLVRWFAHRVQRPGEKLNHALLLGGAQGIGKDTILEPLKHAVGPWNFSEISPTQLLGRFNGFIKSVVLRMSEARDLGDVDRYGLYEHLKTLTAAPPDVLRIDEKNLREYAVMNVCGVIITTNHIDGVYLPPDDRRHFVAWSELRKADFSESYWRDLYRWYTDGGLGHVAAYLKAFDLSGFDPKAPPPKTPAFWRVVDAGRAPEDAEMADALDKLGKPAAVTITQVAVHAGDEFRNWLKDRRSSRQIPHRMETAGYVAVPNPADKTDGRWRVDGKRQVIYGRRDLQIRDRIAAAALLSQGRRP